MVAIIIGEFMKLEDVLPTTEYENYADLSREEQNDLFLKIKKNVDEVNDLKNDEIEAKFMEILENVVILAVEGNGACQDYLSFLYKKGKIDIMKPNYLRAYEWGLIACQSGSKLAVDRLKFFFDASFLSISQNEKLPKIIKEYNLNKDTIEIFFASNIADMMISCSSINLLRLSKEPLIPIDYSEEKMRELERIRDRVIEDMMNKL